MDLVLITKCVGALAAIFAIAKIIYELSVNGRNHLKDDYKFAKEFLDDTDRTKLHPYTLAKGYQAIAGTPAVKAGEVEYILSLENSYECLRDFVYCKRLFQRLETQGNFKLKFIEQYSLAATRNRHKQMYMILYYVLVVVACSPLIAHVILPQSLTTMFMLLAITLPTFGTLAFVCADNHIRFIRAEDLFVNQDYHIQREQ